MASDTLTFKEGESLADIRPGISVSAPAQEFSSIIDAAGQSNLVVPFGVMLLKADFVREGPDLLLIGPNGE